MAFFESEEERFDHLTQWVRPCDEGEVTAYRFGKVDALRR
jgi:hypothetical protein